MYEEQFSKRLAELRTKKGVSARDMSLSIGQNPGYIRAIECGTTFPTMSNFFYICEYLNVTPQEFFNFSEEPSNGMNALTDQLQQFDSEQVNALVTWIREEGIPTIDVGRAKRVRKDVFDDVLKSKRKVEGDT